MTELMVTPHVSDATRTFSGFYYNPLVAVKTDVCGHAYFSDECMCWLWDTGTAKFVSGERAPFRWAGA